MIDAVLVAHEVSGSESGDVIDAVLVVQGVSGSESGDVIDAVLVAQGVSHALTSSRSEYRSRSRLGSSRKQCLTSGQSSSISLAHKDK